MASKKQILEVIETLKNQVERSGYELVEVEEFEEEHEDEIRDFHRVVLHSGGHNVAVQGAVGFDYFTVFYPYYFASAISDSIDENQAQAVFEDTETPEDKDELKSKAAIRLLEQIDSKKMSQLDYELSKQVSSPLTGYEMWRTEEGAIYGFHIEKKIFPFEEDYSLNQFNEAVQAVISQGMSGRKFLDRVFNIDLPEGETATGVDLSVGIPEQSNQV